MGELTRIYNLADDHHTINAVQKATTTTPDFGIVPIPALFGSDPWWSAIETGELQQQWLEGPISKVYWGSMGDWPTFEITSADSGKTTWTSLGDHTRYVVGLRAKVGYVLQFHKDGSETHSVVEVWVEESARRTERSAPGPDEVIKRGSIDALEVAAG